MSTELLKHHKCDRCGKKTTTKPNKDNPNKLTLPKEWSRLFFGEIKFIDAGSCEREVYGLNLDVCKDCKDGAEECFREAWYKAQNKLEEYRGVK